MSSVLPFEIIALIIDIVGENQNKNLLRELALVSHSFLQICSKHLFATIELHDTVTVPTSSKGGYVKLLKSRPDVVKYIRKLTYNVGPYYVPNDDHRLSPILPNFLRTISRLNCLIIDGADFDWNVLDSSLTSALLHLMHLPTINHIDLSHIFNFPLSSLALSVNLRRLDIFDLDRSNPVEEDDSPEIVIQSEVPKIREFHTFASALLTTKFWHAKKHDRPAFNIMDLGRLSISCDTEQNARYLLENAKLLEKLHLRVDFGSILGLLSLRSSTLKVLDLEVPLCPYFARPSLEGLCEELEAMAGHNILEALSVEVWVHGEDETEDFIGSIFQKVEKVLVKHGWSLLKQVSFRVSVVTYRSKREELCEVLQFLPDKYLSHLPKLESVAFNYYSVNVRKYAKHEF